MHPLNVCIFGSSLSSITSGAETVWWVKIVRGKRGSFFTWKVGGAALSLPGSNPWPAPALSLSRLLNGVWVLVPVGCSRWHDRLDIQIRFIWILFWVKARELDSLMNVVPPLCPHRDVRTERIPGPRTSVLLLFKQRKSFASLLSSPETDVDRQSSRIAGRSKVGGLSPLSNYPWIQGTESQHWILPKNMSKKCIRASLMSPTTLTRTKMAKIRTTH